MEIETSTYDFEITNYSNSTSFSVPQLEGKPPTWFTLSGGSGITEITHRSHNGDRRSYELSKGEQETLKAVLALVERSSKRDGTTTGFDTNLSLTMVIAHEVRLALSAHRCGIYFGDEYFTLPKEFLAYMDTASGCGTGGSRDRLLESFDLGTRADLPGNRHCFNL